MTILDANGKEVAHERCTCGRHRQAVDSTCCRFCPTNQHSSACNMRQEAFPDTRRGVFVSEGVVLRVRNHERPRSGFAREER
jgi:hypothetical protein